MHCINCGHKQNEGRFCAVCGTAMGDQQIEMEQTRSRAIAKSEASPNEFIEKVKGTSKMYGSYFLNYLRRPSEALKHGEKEFVNGLVTIVILGLLVGLAFFSVMTSIGSSYGLSFFSTMSNSLLLILFITALVVGSLFLTTKFLGPDQTFKNIFGIYGTHLIPSTFLVVIALVLILLKAYVFGNLLLSFALIFAFFIVPLYILIKLLQQEESALDPLYCVIVYIVIFGIAFSIFLSVVGDTIMGDVISRSNFFL